MKIRYSRLSAIAAALFLSASAAASSPEKPDAALTEVRWKLVRIAGDNTFSPSQAYVIFRAGEKHLLEGNGGCNRFGGRYTMQEDTLTVSGLRSTRIMCPRMKHESTFLGRLQGSHHYLSKAIR